MRDAALRGNTFSSYALEAVHIEDYSQDVLIQDNQFRACGLRDYSHVQIISGSRRVRVIGNSFDAAMNTRPIYVVNALPGGDGPTAGDRPPRAPFDVEVRDNRFVCAAPSCRSTSSGGRRIDHGQHGHRAGGRPRPAEAFRLLEDPGSAVSGNLINGPSTRSVSRGRRAVSRCVTM